MNSPGKLQISVVAGVLCLSSVSGCASRPAPVSREPITTPDTAPPQVTVLGDDLSPLRREFNRTSDRWRAVALVSPTCSECVLGAHAVQKEITARYPADQVPALIVWIPMLDSDNEQRARESATIFEPRRACQFYDGRKTLGTRYARQTFAGLHERARKSVPDDHWLASILDEHSDSQRPPPPQWDLYMLYAPGIRWEEPATAPPMPTHWIRHLGRNDDGKTSTYWKDSPESGPRQGDLFEAIRTMTDEAIGDSPAESRRQESK